MKEKTDEKPEVNQNQNNNNKLELENYWLLQERQPEMAARCPVSGCWPPCMNRYRQVNKLLESILLVSTVPYNSM